MDILDAYTPAGGDIMHAIPPYVGGGYCGRTLPLNRTEEVRGSNPRDLYLLDQKIHNKSEMIARS
jgi:hypothetical protein